MLLQLKRKDRDMMITSLIFPQCFYLLLHFLFLSSTTSHMMLYYICIGESHRQAFCTYSSFLTNRNCNCFLFSLFVVLSSLFTVISLCSPVIESTQQCTASNGISSIKHSAKLRVFGPPSIRPMENLTAVSGESFTILCPVSGHPIEQIYWEKGNNLSLYYFSYSLFRFR